MGRLGARKPVNHTCWMTVVTPTDRPKSVRNCCVIEMFGGIFVLSIGFRIFSWYGVFVIELSQISFFFALWLNCSFLNISERLPYSNKRRMWHADRLRFFLWIPFETCLTYYSLVFVTSLSQICRIFFLNFECQTSLGSSFSLFRSSDNTVEDKTEITEMLLTY